MLGCRPLEDSEVEKISEYFKRSIGDEYEDEYNLLTRNHALFFFGLYTGFRINESLSLNIGDVIEGGKIKPNCYVKKSNMKGKTCGRNVELNDQCKEVLTDYANHYGLWDKDPRIALWFSRKSDRITDKASYNIYCKIFKAVGLQGKLGTHTSRKTFAKKVFNTLDRNILDLKKAMGHKSVASTQAYIEPNDEKVMKAIKSLNFKGGTVA